MSDLLYIKPQHNGFIIKGECGPINPPFIRRIQVKVTLSSDDKFDSLKEALKQRKLLLLQNDIEALLKKYFDESDISFRNDLKL